MRQMDLDYLALFPSLVMNKSACFESNVKLMGYLRYLY